MIELNNMLFALLRSVLCAEELDASLFGELDEAKLESLYKISKKHDLAHLLSAALDKAGLLTDNEVSKKFGKQQFVAVYRYENLKYEYERICLTLEEARIPYIPLKGSVIRDLYPEPWMRTSCDIDILVHESDLEGAVTALVESLGYRANEEREYHDVSLFSDSGVHLELHFNIKENNDLLDHVLEQVWNYAEPVDDGAHKFELSKEFFIYHIFAHASYHFVSGGCGIRPFVDLWILNRVWTYDRKAVIELCKQSKIEDFALAMRSLSEVWLAGEKHSELTEKMEKYLLEGGVYGTQESVIAIKQQTHGGKLGYAFSHIFASYEQLKIKYPSLKSKLLVPVYQVRRWVDGIREKKLKRSVRLLKKNASIDKSKSDEIGSLMNELKLNNHIK